MPDNRDRSDRPRRRGGQRRLADLAVAKRHQEHIAHLQGALQPEAEALRDSTPAMEVVGQIRSKATILAQERLEGDVTPIVEATLDEIFGLGPLEPVLRDQAVDTIRIENAVIFANGERASRGFRDAAHARQVVDRILASVDQDLAASPQGVQAVMMDGSRMRAWEDEAVLHVEIRRRDRSRSERQESKRS
ncbi:MAG: hypothetical protein AAGA48_29010 [Myxococcota bacterium]